jgi:hypothetical protein
MFSTKNIFLVLVSVLLFSACKSYENSITIDLFNDYDSRGFYFATQQDSINFENRLNESYIKTMAFIKKMEEQKKHYLVDPPFYEAQYPGGLYNLRMKILENLNLPKDAKKGITKIRIIVDKEGCSNPEILQCNDKRVKKALIESIYNVDRWMPASLLGERHPFKIDCFLTIKSEKKQLIK